MTQSQNNLNKMSQNNCKIISFHFTTKIKILILGCNFLLNWKYHTIVTLFFITTILQLLVFFLFEFSMCIPKGELNGICNRGGWGGGLQWGGNREGNIPPKF